MTDQTNARKNKITLSDYDYQRDIENRLFMAQLDASDIHVLEEILYSSITISIKKLSKTLDIPEAKLRLCLEKIEKTKLFTISGEILLVDKEMRKYYESQLLKFDKDFKPGMDFLQSLLRKVPIHVLPTWYSIPRTSNNIFDSITEKYLYTPQIFQRYLMELTFDEPILSNIIQDVYQAPNCILSAQKLIEKYHLSKEQFEEYMLILEFSFVACLGYTQEGEHLVEQVSPFHEWAEFLRFAHNTIPEAIKEESQIEIFRSNPFSFIQDMSAILTAAKKKPLSLTIPPSGNFSFEEGKLAEILSEAENLHEKDPQVIAYIRRLIEKLRLIKLAEIIDGRLYALESAAHFLDMREENRAIHLFRHPINQLKPGSVNPHLYTERNLREAEKSINRVLYSGWILFDDFVKGVIIPLSDESAVVLKKIGKTWKYTLPEYTEEEYAFIRETVLEWLYEAGIVMKGVIQGKACFCVTPFGQSLFSK